MVDYFLDEEVNVDDVLDKNVEVMREGEETGVKERRDKLIKDKKTLREMEKLLDSIDRNLKKQHKGMKERQHEAQLLQREIELARRIKGEVDGK